MMIPLLLLPLPSSLLPQIQIRSAVSQGEQFNPQRSSGGGRQSGYRDAPSESRGTRGNDYNPQRSSGGGRQSGYRDAPSESRGTRGNDYYPQRFSGDYGAASRGSDSRRTQQRSNDNPERTLSDGNDSRDATSRSYSQRRQENDYNTSQRSRPAGNAGPKDGSRVRDARGQGRGGKDSSSAKRNSSKTPNPVSQTFTPRQSTSQFVSDRSVHRAPWEQGPSKSSSRVNLERITSVKNPLIERLKRMQAEIAADEAEDAIDDEDGIEGDGFRPNLDRGFQDFDDEARFDGSRENSAMARIVDRLSKIPGSREVYRPQGRGGAGVLDETDSTPGPQYGQPMFPDVRRGWSTPDNPVPTPAAPSSSQRFRPDTRFPWEREEAKGEAPASEKYTRVKPPSLAELTLPEDELKRLRSLGILSRHRIKVGKLGVTNGIVESVHNEWRNSEVVRVKCEGPPAQNMKRTHETLEERTGGLVVWRAGGACLVYRGKDYVPPPLRGLLDLSQQSASSSKAESEESDVENEAEENDSETDEMEEGGSEQTVAPKIIVPRVSSVYDPELERELEEILSTLGARYDDWTGSNPVPVDADLLTGSDVEFKKPFRQLPFGVKPSLSNLELTNVRRLGRPLPPHFVLGVNKGLEGLAAAIVKLWEKSEIAKIAVKRGIQNTNHERMAEQLKRLTGGVLLSRDKYFIVLYRGKDFLPPTVAAVLEERQAMTMALQDEEEKARLLPQTRESSDTSVERSIAGTLAETLEAKASWERMRNSDEQLKIEEDARRSTRRDMTRRIQRKVAITMSKKKRAELELQKVEKRLQPAGPPLDRENITEEERHMYSKLGLKMHAFLLLGRRGVFDGTVENMHLHWKHRPLVKVIYKATDRLDLEQTARMLEYESGGILVATIPTNKGQAIIVYRGKNYQRPPELRPRTLLTKRQALKRSIEMQRQTALTRHLLALEKEIDYMQADLNKLGLEEEDHEASEEPTATVLEVSQEETEKESTVSELLESPDEDVEDAGDRSMGDRIERQNPDLIYRADPLSRREKLILRQQALKEKKRAAHFNVGRSNVLAGLARAIRIHFRKHALVKVGVKGRARGTPVEEILYQLEEATGGTLVSQELSKVILYRGWPDGQQRPTEETGRWEELPPQLRSAMIAEVEADDDYLHESDWDESDDEDEEADDMDDEEGLETKVMMDDAEADDGSDWDEFEEDDEEDNEDYLDTDLDLRLQEDEDEDEEEDEDKGEEESVSHEMAVNDAV